MINIIDLITNNKNKNSEGSDNRKKDDPYKRACISKGCIDSYFTRGFEYAFLNDHKNFSGMIRGATLHFSNFKNELSMCEELGYDTSEFISDIKRYNKYLNSDIAISLIAKSYYAKELIEEGWFTKATIEKMNTIIETEAKKINTTK